MRDYLQTAEEAARLAGQVLRSWASKFTVREKSRSNLVTEADTAAQQTIYEFLRKRYPNHSFLGEEGLADHNGQSPYCWVIDPLDGTTNYVHGFPYYAVSIGLQHDGRLIAGAVYNPVSEEMFLAADGHGAWLNRQPLRCSQVRTLSEAFVIASLPVATAPDDPAVKRFLRVLGHAQTVQRTGSAALNLAFLAAGRIDGFWSTSLKPWDMAAGVLLVQEAGGRISRIDGESFQLEQSDLLATNGTDVHAQLSQTACLNWEFRRFRRVGLRSRVERRLQVFPSLRRHPLPMIAPRHRRQSFATRLQWRLCRWSLCGVLLMVASESGHAQETSAPKPASVSPPVEGAAVRRTASDPATPQTGAPSASSPSNTAAKSGLDRVPREKRYFQNANGELVAVPFDATVEDFIEFLRRKLNEPTEQAPLVSVSSIEMEGDRNGRRGDAASPIDGRRRWDKPGGGLSARPFGSRDPRGDRALQRPDSVWRKGSGTGISLVV